MPSYKWYNMWNRPLEYAVKCGSKTVIPEGAKRVKIAFRQSHLFRKDDITGKMVHMNVYLYKGKIFHA